jgi:hypothetical protein
VCFTRIELDDLAAMYERPRRAKRPSTLLKGVAE